MLNKDKGSDWIRVMGEAGKKVKCETGRGVRFTDETGCVCVCLCVRQARDT